MNSLVIFLLILIPIGALLALKFRRNSLRKRLFDQLFPSEWRDILEEKSALYRAFPFHLKDDLHRLIRIFLSEKRFEGCGGLEVSQEMKLVIACQACLLVVNHGTRLYPNLSSILLYPKAFWTTQRVDIGSSHVLEFQEERIGESWKHGSIVLVWEETQADAAGGTGNNVVLHEFAHQLDQEDSASDGAPILKTREEYATWARVLGQEFERLRKDLANRYPTLLRAYAATDPAEFFAVATEVFFEKPEAMQRRHPDLYRELKNYYGLDPADWVLELVDNF